MTTTARFQKTSAPQPPAGRGWRSLLTGAFILVCLVGVTGCQSVDKPASASFASVEITNRTPDQIREATVAVFRENGFTQGAGGGTELVFEQEGSSMNRIAYGNWMGGTPVYVRVKASIVPLAEGQYRLQCNAHMVRDKDDSFFEEEVKLTNIRRRPYQDMLDKVAKRLRQQP
jgi:hypothetical protein